MNAAVAPAEEPQEVAGGRLAVCDLPPSLRAPGEARRRARSVLAGWGITDPDTHALVELVISELVTNAIAHGGAVAAGPQLRIEAGETLLVSVSDGSLAPPVAQACTTTGESGRGLAIVSAVALEWGTERGREGKRVWARLEGPRPEPATLRVSPRPPS